MREKIEATFQKLDRLTQVENRVTQAQSLEVLYGLLQNIKILMGGEHCAILTLAGCRVISPIDNKASMDNIQESLGMFYGSQS